jgi:hypothetical protein
MQSPDSHSPDLLAAEITLRRARLRAAQAAGRARRHRAAAAAERMASALLRLAAVLDARRPPVV